MSRDEQRFSRRSALQLGLGAAAGAALGIAAWEAARRPDQPVKLVEQIAVAADKPTAPLGPIIDAHVHVVRSILSTDDKPDPNDPDERDGPIERVVKVVQDQMKAAGVEHALCMPSRGQAVVDPLGVEGTRQLAKLIPGLHPIGMADPERFDEPHLERVEESLKRGDVRGLKAYLGYLHHGPDSPGYYPYYRLAAKYKIPFIFHTGDTYSHLAKLKYAHPLPIDDVAVDFPETNFVLAHLGNPWLMDAAELIYKNNKPPYRENVWGELSGLIVGSAENFEQYRQEGALEIVMNDVRKAIGFAERPDRILYGSDWPLAPMATYRDFIRELVPAEFHQAVFHDNAQALFELT